MTERQVTESERAKMLIRGIPPRLKAKLAKRVEQRGSNLNDVVVEVLAAEFGVPFAIRSRKPSGKIGPYPNVVFRLPPELKSAIDQRAAARSDSIRNVVIEILSNEFGVPFVATSRWPKRSAA